MRISRRKLLAGLSSAGTSLLLPNKSIAGSRGGGPVVFFDTTGLTIGGGSMAYAQQLANGNIIYACMRSSVKTKVGVAEVNPSTRAEIFTFNDPGWGTSGGLFAGPEIITKYSNGNYLIANVDGLQGTTVNAIVYEMLPNNTTAWTWNGSATSNGLLGTNNAKPVTIGGTDYVMIFGCGNNSPPHERDGIEVIRRSDQSTVFHLTLSSINEVNSGAYRNIGGTNYILCTIFVNDVNAYLVNFDTQSLVKTYNLGDLVNAPSSGWDVEWLDDNTILLSCGFNGAIAVVTLEPTPVLKWKSRVFSRDNSGVATPTTCATPLATDGSKCLVCTRNSAAAPGIIFQSPFKSWL